MEQGFIILQRKISENWLWLSEPFSKAQAWVDLLLLANHAEGSFFIRGVKVIIKRGQVGKSEENLSQRWKWSRGKVRAFLKMLETEQQVKQLKSPILNVIEIINYNLYQKLDNRLNNKKTTERQQKDTNKEEEITIKEEINNIIDSNFEEFWNLYDYKKARPKALSAFKSALKKESYEKIKQGLEVYVKARGNDKQYWKHPTTWLNGECWNDDNSSVSQPQNNLVVKINQIAGGEYFSKIIEKEDSFDVYCSSGSMQKVIALPEDIKNLIKSEFNKKINLR